MKILILFALVFSFIKAEASYVAALNTTMIYSMAIPEFCKKVTNGNANPLFVPTNTTMEWNSFLAHLPPNTSVSDCTVYYACWTSTQKNYCANANSVTLCNPFSPSCACMCNWNSGGGWQGWQFYPTTYDERSYDASSSQVYTADKPYCVSTYVSCSKNYR